MEMQTETEIDKLVIRATFDEEGFATGFYPSDVWPEGYPVEAVEITPDQYSEFLEHIGQRKWTDGEVIEYLPPEPEPQPVVIVVPALTLWDRMTNQEAEQVDEAMASQPFRIRQIFLTAPTFRSDHELWPLLETIATQLFGEARAAELLAP